MSAEALRRLMGVYADEAERCIRCGFCNSVCPTTLTSIGYSPSRTSRGRLVMLQSALSIGRPDPFSPKLKELIDLCIGCMRCVKVCPAGIPIPHVNAGFRAAYKAYLGGSVGWAERLLAGFDDLAETVGGSPVLRRILLNRVSLGLLKDFFGLSRDAPIPTPESRSLDQHLSGLKTVGYELYAYFADTYARYLSPSIGLDARRLLNMAGIELYMPKQRGSGVIQFELGLWDRLKVLASANVESLYQEALRGRRIVCTSPASTMMLREIYPRILPSEKSERVSEAVIDINELLYELVSNGRLTGLRVKGSYTLHSSCLSQHLGLTEKVRALLETLGARIEGVRTECCGSGGTWGMLRKNRRLSVEIGSRLVERLAGKVLSYSETCTEQIKSLSRGRVEVYLPHQAIMRSQQVSPSN
ncbi:MAG: (Fe-S)-binding protein [Candidatus Caldarchaeales archaeon]|nr:(Fe-S)-binding protein [Candidatus Caldarchaeales archaeon]MDT7914908.1 (Fe-S)-binding protein [Candidatus Caldarchaeales archaeon]